MGAITAEIVDTGEKRDARGRRRVPAAQRAQMVEAYRTSGLTMAEFARREAINYSTFAGWYGKARRSESTGASPIKFAEVRLPLTTPGPGPAVPDDRLEVRLPDGTMIRGCEAAEVVKLVRELRS